MGGQWAVEVPVDAETQLITATATTIVGASTTAAVGITVPGAASQPLRLRGTPVDGIVPVVVKWQVSNQTGHALVQYEFDSTGGGVFDAPVTSFDAVQTTYAIAGLFFPTLRVTDDQGTAYAATTIVLASDPAAVTARFQGLWTAFKARLQAGDTNGALTFLALSLQPRMQAVFQQLGADLPTIVAGFGDVHVTDQAGTLVEVVVTQVEAESPALYFIYYRQDSLGRWLIEEM